MDLRMSNGPTGVQTLPADDETVVTTPMGACVSVIVLHTLQGIRYQYVKGQHGLGGIDVIHFPTLFAGVPDVFSSQIIVVPGSEYQSQITITSIREKIFTYTRRHGLNNVNIRIITGYSNAGVDRQGMIHGLHPAVPSQR